MSQLNTERRGTATTPVLLGLTLWAATTVVSVAHAGTFYGECKLYATSSTNNVTTEYVSTGNSMDYASSRKQIKRCVNRTLNTKLKNLETAYLNDGVYYYSALSAKAIMHDVWADCSKSPIAWGVVDTGAEVYIHDHSALGSGSILGWDKDYGILRNYSLTGKCRSR